MRIVMRIGLASMAAVLVACASVHAGKKVSQDDVSLLERGVTTQRDVRRSFGEPTFSRVDSDGRAVWRYEYEEVKSRDTGTLTRLACSVGVLLRIPACLFQPMSYRSEKTIRDELTVYFDAQSVVASFSYTHEERPLSGVYDPALGIPGGSGPGRGQDRIPSTIPIADDAPGRDRASRR